MIVDFKLVGLSKPRCASIERLNNKSEEKKDIPSGLTEKVFNELFDYCDNDWGEQKIAQVECELIDKDGWPVSPMLVGIHLLENNLIPDNGK